MSILCPNVLRGSIAVSPEGAPAGRGSRRVIGGGADLEGGAPDPDGAVGEREQHHLLHAVQVPRAELPLSVDLSRRRG